MNDRDPWMPTSKQRLWDHLLNEHGLLPLSTSKRTLSVFHGTAYRGCGWTANRPRIVNRPSAERVRRRLDKAMRAAAFAAMRGATK